MATSFHHIEHFQRGCFYGAIPLLRKAGTDPSRKIFADKRLIAHHITKTNGSDVVHIPSSLNTCYS